MMLGSTTLIFACCKNAQTQISSCLHIPTTTMPVPMSQFGPRIVTCHVVVPELKNTLLKMLMDMIRKMMIPVMMMTAIMKEQLL